MDKGRMVSDTNVLGNFSISVSTYADHVSDACSTILSVCNNMLNNADLKGDGADDIRACFTELQTGYTQLVQSSKSLVLFLNKAMLKNRQAADEARKLASSTNDSIHGASRNVGAFAKDKR